MPLARRAWQALVAPTSGGFLLRLAILWSPLVAIPVMRPLREAIEGPLTLGYANVVGGILRLLGEPCVVHGTTVRSTEDGLSLIVEPVCTGYFLFWVYAAAILAFPATWPRRVRAIGLGLLLVFSLNVVRIASLHYALRAVPELFDDLHYVVWQAVLVGSVLAAWWVWASQPPRDTPPTPQG